MTFSYKPVELRMVWPPMLIGVCVTTVIGFLLGISAAAGWAGVDVLTGDHDDASWQAVQALGTILALFVAIAAPMVHQWVKDAAQSRAIREAVYDLGEEMHRATIELHTSVARVNLGEVKTAVIMSRGRALYASEAIIRIEVHQLLDSASRSSCLSLRRIAIDVQSIAFDVEETLLDGDLEQRRALVCLQLEDSSRRTKDELMRLERALSHRTSSDMDD